MTADHPRTHSIVRQFGAASPQHPGAIVAAYLKSPLGMVQAYNRSDDRCMTRRWKGALWPQGTILTCYPEARKSTCNLHNLPSFPPLPIWPTDWCLEFVLRNQILSGTSPSIRRA